MPDIIAATTVLDDASQRPAATELDRNEFKAAADHLRTFEGGYIPGKESVSDRLPMVKIHLADMLLRLLP